MTQQTPDTFIYKEQEYVIAGLKGDGLLKPMDFNIVPDGFATSCYRGYFCQYTCHKNALFLTELSIFNETSQLPNIHKVVPKSILDVFARYQGLKIQCSFSGSLIIVRNPVDPVGILPSPLEFEEVIEVNFEQGWLQSEKDYSSQVHTLRHIIDEIWSKLDDPSELTEKFLDWMSKPEQPLDEDMRKIKKYFDERDRLEWSFVEGYEQQPPISS